MPNNSTARREKEKKKKRRGETSQSSPQQVAEQSVESFLSRSASDSGFQEEDDEVAWESVVGQAAMDDSLSSLTRPPSSLEPKLTRKEERRRARKEALEKELDEESDISLSDDDRQGTEPASRKISLSPIQFLQSIAMEPLNRSRAIGQEEKGNPLVFASPVQVLGAKGNGASDEVPVEAVACVAASGANSAQRGEQGHPQGSSSVSFPSPSFNLPPTERAQVLHRSLAAELILAGTGTSPLIPPARNSQESGTAISMTAYNSARGNNLNPSVQVSGTRAARVEAQAQQEVQPRTKLARGQEATPFKTAFTRGAIEEQDRVNDFELQRMAADRVRQRGLREPARPLQVEPEATTGAARTESISPTTVVSTPVLDMFFCIDHLADIRTEAGDYTLKDYSDYYAPDSIKKAPNPPKTFEPTRLVKGNHPLWAPFFNPGRTRLADDGTMEADPDHPPHFRVSRQLMGACFTRSKRSTWMKMSREKPQIVLASTSDAKLTLSPLMSRERQRWCNAERMNFRGSMMKPWSHRIST
jgi:hypothetical protein